MRQKRHHRPTAPNKKDSFADLIKPRGQPLRGSDSHAKQRQRKRGQTQALEPIDGNDSFGSVFDEIDWDAGTATTEPLTPTKVVVKPRIVPVDTKKVNATLSLFDTTNVIRRPPNGITSSAAPDTSPRGKQKKNPRVSHRRSSTGGGPVLSGESRKTQPRRASLAAPSDFNTQSRNGKKAEEADPPSNVRRKGEAKKTQRRRSSIAHGLERERSRSTFSQVNDGDEHRQRRRASLACTRTNSTRHVAKIQRKAEESTRTGQPGIADQKARRRASLGAVPSNRQKNRQKGTAARRRSLLGQCSILNFDEDSEELFKVIDHDHSEYDGWNTFVE